MTPTLRPVVGLVTIGQSPREDVVPEMAAVIGPAADVREAGALDGLTRAQIDALQPTGDDEILVTRLQDGTAVFVGKQKIVTLVEGRIAELERGGATITALLCTGAFPPLTASRPLIQPQPLLVGALRAMRWPGRLGVVTPSVPHVPQSWPAWPVRSETLAWGWSRWTAWASAARPATSFADSRASLSCSPTSSSPA